MTVTETPDSISIPDTLGTAKRSYRVISKISRPVIAAESRSERRHPSRFEKKKIYNAVPNRSDLMSGLRPRRRTAGPAQRGVLGDVAGLAIGNGGQGNDMLTLIIIVLAVIGLVALVSGRMRRRSRI